MGGTGTWSVSLWNARPMASTEAEGRASWIARLRRSQASAGPAQAGSDHRGWAHLQSWDERTQR